jgi:ABC-2 type transport system permease protein
MRIKVITQLTLIHFKNYFREPAAVFWSFVFPIALAWVIGTAFTQQPQRSITLYVQGNEKPVLPELLLPESGVQIHLKIINASKEKISEELKNGTCIIYATKESGGWKYHFDPNNTDAANAWLTLKAAADTSSGEVPEKVVSKGFRYVDFLMPGMMAMGIMNSCIWGIGWYLIELRMKKLMRRMSATPMKKTEFLLSHLITRFILCVLESSQLWLFAWLFFDIELSGSVAGFVLLYTSGVLCFVGMGFLMASRTANTYVGNGLINAVVMPMTIVSGVFFSYRNFPEWACSVIEWLPLSLLCDGLRALFNQAAGINEILIPSLLLSVTGIVCFVVGLKIFKWY